MLSFIMNKQELPSNPILPNEIMYHISSFTQNCSSFAKFCRVYNDDESYDSDDSYDSNDDEFKNGIRIYDFNTLKITYEFIIPDKIDDYYKPTLSPCGTFFVAASSNQKILIWNIYTRKLIQVVKFESNVHNLYLLFTSNEKLLIGFNNNIHSFTFSSKINMFQLEHVYEIPESTGHITCLTQNLAYKFACGTSNGYTYVFNVISKKLVNTINAAELIDSEIQYINFRKNKLVVLSYNQIIICFDLDTNEKSMLQKPRIVNHHLQFYINDFLITPCLNKLIGSYSGGNVRYVFCWDFASGKIIKKMDFELGNSNAFSPDGLKLIRTSDDSDEIVVNAWDLTG